MAAAATEDLWSYLADIGAIAASPAETQNSPAQRPHPPLRGPDPQKSAAIREYLGDPKTVGHLYDADGLPIDGVEELRSGRNGPGKGAPHLRYPHKHMTSLNEHVEGHVAAYMRKSRTRYVEVYTNRDPCPGENGCAERTAEALPDGTYRMVVFSESEEGTLRTHFDGTGEGVDL